MRAFPLAFTHHVKFTLAHSIVRVAYPSPYPLLAFLNTLLESFKTLDPICQGIYLQQFRHYLGCPIFNPDLFHDDIDLLLGLRALICHLEELL